MIHPSTLRHKLRTGSAQEDGNKRSSLKIKSAKTTSKRRSTARAVRTTSSTRGLLPLCFFVVFYAFYLRAVLRIANHSRLVSSRRNVLFILYDWSSNLSFWRRKDSHELLTLALCTTHPQSTPTLSFWRRKDSHKLLTLARLILVDDFLFHAYSFLLSWYKRNKRSSLKIKSAKTTLKRRSTARAVRTTSSTRGLLPLCFFIVFYAFYLRAVLRIVKHSRLVSIRRNALFILYNSPPILSFWRRKNPINTLSL